MYVCTIGHVNVSQEQGMHSLISPKTSPSTPDACRDVPRLAGLHQFCAHEHGEDGGEREEEVAREELVEVSALHRGYAPARLPSGCLTLRGGFAVVESRAP